MTLRLSTDQMIRDLADQYLTDDVIAIRAGVTIRRVRQVLDDLPRPTPPDCIQQHYNWWAALSRGTATWYRKHGRPAEERTALGHAARFAELARIAS